jgi:hypothetical protein
MSVSLIQLPRTLEQKVIASSDTAAISLIAAAAGKTVKLWGLVVMGGTSAVLKSDTTALSGVIPTTGLVNLPLPSGNPADAAYPYFESAVGEALTITPGASGLNGVAYYTQD